MNYCLLWYILISWSFSNKKQYWIFFYWSVCFSTCFISQHHLSNKSPVIKCCKRFRHGQKRQWRWRWQRGVGKNEAQLSASLHNIITKIQYHVEKTPSPVDDMGKDDLSITTSSWHLCAVWWPGQVEDAASVWLLQSMRPLQQNGWFSWWASDIGAFTTWSLLFKAHYPWHMS